LAFVVVRIGLQETSTSPKLDGFRDDVKSLRDLRFVRHACGAEAIIAAAKFMVGPKTPHGPLAEALASAVSKPRLIERLSDLGIGEVVEQLVAQGKVWADLWSGSSLPETCGEPSSSQIVL
jgi:hypothetical protein